MVVASRHPFSLYVSANLHYTMTGQLEQVVIERRQHLCLADKLRLMAQTLRNCKEKQCIGRFYDGRNNSMCAYGALGYMSGMPKDDLPNEDFTGVLRNYGLDLDDSGIMVNLPDEVRDEIYPERQVTLCTSLYQMNDRGFSFKEIATYLDIWADNLQS